MPGTSIWLAAGYAFCAGHSEVKIGPAMPGAVEGTFQIREQRDLLPMLHQRFNLKIIGMDVYSHAGQLDGGDPPDWRSSHLIEGTDTWPATSSADTWSDIGNAAYTKRMGYLWDLSRRLTNQLRICGFRLRQAVNRH